MIRSLAGLAVAAALAAAPSAHAAQVTVTGGAALYTAAPGEANRLSIEVDATGITLRDAVPITGCTPIEGGVRCQGANRIEAQLGDGDDRFTGGAGPVAAVAGPDLPIAVFGGDGADVLAGGPASELLDGRDGNDLVDGGGGQDLVRGWDGDDAVSGGDGADVVADGTGSDRVDAGPGDDELLVFEDAAPERVACGGGRDTIVPGATDLPELDCERVKFCACTNGAMPPRSLAVIEGVATFRVACPTVLDGRSTCRGRLTVSQPVAAPEGTVVPQPFTARSPRYAIPDGRSRLVHVKLPDHVRRHAIAQPLAVRLRIVLDKRTRKLRGEYLVTMRAGD